MTKSFHACNPPTGEGKTKSWFTPFDIIDALGNDFDLDPCTQSSRPFDTAANHLCEDKGVDGLSMEWFGNVWLNPPYGKNINIWLEKLSQHGKGIALVFSRTETQWAQKILSVADAVNFIKGRISFIRHDGSKSNSAANGNMLIAFGTENVSKIRKIPGVIFERKIQ